MSLSLQRRSVMLTRVWIQEDLFARYYIAHQEFASSDTFTISRLLAIFCGGDHRLWRTVSESIMSHDFTFVIDIILPVIKGRAVQKFRHGAMRYNEKDDATQSPSAVNAHILLASSQLWVGSTISVLR